MDTYNIHIKPNIYKLLPVQYLFIGLAFATALLYSQGSSARLLAIYIIAFAACALLWREHLLELYIVMSPFTGDIMSNYVSIALFAIALFALISQYGLKITMKSFFFVVLTICVVAFSSFFGHKPDLNIALLSLLYFITVVYISGMNAETTAFKDLAIALIIRTVAVAIYLGLQALSGESVLLFGRLSFSGSARDIDTVAYIAVFGVFFSIVMMFGGDKAKRSTRMLTWIGFAISVITLALTLNRGAIFSCIIALVAYVLIQKQKRIDKIIKMSLIVGIVYLLLISTEGLRIERMSDFELSGRLEGWKHYFALLVSGGYILGFGPGDLQRMSGEIYSSFYSHSFFVDVVCSYGIVGVAYLFIMISVAIKAMKRTDSSVKKCVLIGIFCTGLTHGVVADFNLLISYAILIGWINSEKKMKIFNQNSDSSKLMSN